MFKVNVNRNIVSVQETEPITAGSVSVYYCKFTFDSSWDGFFRSAVFRVGATTRTVPLDDDNTCDIPWELLVKSNIGLPVEVSVYGTKSETEILPTIWDRLGRIRGGSEPGDDVKAPSPSTYDRITGLVRAYADKMASEVESVKESVDEAEAAAKAAAETASQIGEAIEITTTAASAAAASSESAERSATHASESASNAMRSAEDAEEWSKRAELIAGGGVLSFKGRTGDVQPASGDYTSDMVGAAPAVHTHTPDQVGAVNPNLLHNWYFANPVNQRGQTEYSGTEYTIDRWFHRWTGSVIVHDGYTELTDETTIDQNMENPFGHGTYTFSVLYHDGVFASGTLVFAGSQVGLWMPHYRTNVSISDSVARIYTSGAENKIVAVKLELGSTQTLAHQENGVWVLNEIHDYNEELRKCQRYQFPIDTESGIVFGRTETDSSLTLEIPLPVIPRANGVLADDLVIVAVADGSYAELIIPSGTTVVKHSNGVTIKYTARTSLAPTTPVNVYVSNGALIDFNL